MIRSKALQAFSMGFGLTYIEQLMQMQGRRLEVIFPSDTDNEPQFG
jgi:hypothetical protein